MIKKLELEITQDGSGRPILYFPFMSISDVHWGSRMCRAKRLCQMLQNTHTDRLDAIGDMVDGEVLIKKRHWNMGPYHRFGIAHLFRKAEHGTEVNGYIGNHEHGLQAGGMVVRYDPVVGHRIEKATQNYRNLVGKEIFGVRIFEKSHYTDPNGRRFRVEHSHLHDNHIFETAEKRTRWYRIGNYFNDLGAFCDQTMQSLSPKFRELSIVAPVKKYVKKFINDRLGVRDAMAQDIDSDDTIDGALYGHSHMGGFDVTPGGKVLMNDGSSTEHVQALVHDLNGTWALITWHPDRMDVELENGDEYKVFWKDLGLEHFSDLPQTEEDEYTKRADRFLRLVYRMWPPHDRRSLKQAQLEQERLVIDLKEKLEQSPSRSTKYRLNTAQEKLDRLTEAFNEKYRTVPIPNHLKTREIIPEYV